MVRQLRRCFETPLRFLCSVMALLFVVLVAALLWFVVTGGLSIGTFCPPEGCPGEATWSAVLEIEQRERDMRASATAEAADRITPTSLPQSEATGERIDDYLHVESEP